MNKVQENINNINNINNKILKLKKDIKSLEIERRIIEKSLWNTCSHNWVRQSDWDDLCNRQCSICGLYQNKYLYNS